jgi:hypothetical protein
VNVIGCSGNRRFLDTSMSLRLAVRDLIAKVWSLTSDARQVSDLPEGWIDQVSDLIGSKTL